MSTTKYGLDAIASKSYLQYRMQHIITHECHSLIAIHDALNDLSSCF
jgi:hypothetical protein